MESAFRNAGAAGSRRGDRHAGGVPRGRRAGGGAAPASRRIGAAVLSRIVAAVAAAALCVVGTATAVAAVPEPGPLGSLDSIAAGSLHFDLGNGVDPIITPTAADPSIVRAPDGTYYLYSTSDDWMDGAGKHQLPIFSSKNLTDWTYAGDVFGAVPGWAQDAGGGLWAPDVHVVNGRYVVYYSVGNDADPAHTDNPCIGMATSDSPTGPFLDLGRAVFCADDVGVHGTIDPYVDYTTGPPVVFVGNFQGVYAIGLTADGTAVAGDDPKDAPVQVAGTGYEAPFIQRRGGFYYMYVSAGNCCNGAASDYRVYVGRSQNLTGPYVDSHGTDMNDGGGDLLLSGNLSWIGPGHNAIVTDDAGTDWIVYHAAPSSQPRLPGGGPQNRQGMIDMVTWVNGWPRVGNGTPSSTAPAVPYIEGQERSEPGGGTGSAQLSALHTQAVQQYEQLRTRVDAALGN